MPLEYDRREEATFRSTVHPSTKRRNIYDSVCHDQKQTCEIIMTDISFSFRRTRRRRAAPAGAMVNHHVQKVKIGHAAALARPHLLPGSSLFESKRGQTPVHSFKCFYIFRRLGREIGGVSSSSSGQHHTSSPASRLPVILEHRTPKRIGSRQQIPPESTAVKRKSRSTRLCGNAPAARGGGEKGTTRSSCAGESRHTTSPPSRRRMKISTTTTNKRRSFSSRLAARRSSCKSYPAIKQRIAKNHHGEFEGILEQEGFLLSILTLLLGTWSLKMWLQ